MKWLIVTCAAITIIGCSEHSQKNTVISPATTMNTILTDAIEQAKKSNDFRLLATKGRRMVIPGFEQNQQQAIKNCDFKYLENTGDILKNEQQRQQRSERYQFASDYNQAIYQLCMKTKNNTDSM